LSVLSSKSKFDSNVAIADFDAFIVGGCRARFSPKNTIN